MDHKPSLMKGLHCIQETTGLFEVASMGTVYALEWSLGSEFWSGVLELSGVRFWSGKSRVECGCDVCVCVCVPDPSL